ncbi:MULTISPECIES: GEVED domain-containing protein [unclassified Streptomyces]|uniref:DUF7927 domain-containing protein n=1 Tax=unclassified Streptomyces TaxID=2593676 RepID=UPI00278C552D|nr:MULTISPECIES: GEVED domain-containing protein [unclassified Streptomyces]
MDGARHWFRRAGVVLGAVLAMVAGPLPVVGASAAHAAAPAPQRAAATPEEPTEVYKEGFENPTGDPVLLSDYTGAAPRNMTYTADPGWLKGCNGWVLNKADSAGYKPGTADCGSWWDQTRDLANALGQLNGSANPDANHAVAAFTVTAPKANSVQFETERPIGVTPGRFYTFGVSSAAFNCYASDPLLKFSLMDGETAIPASAKPINPCTDSEARTISVGGRSAKAVHTTSDAPVLFKGSTLGVRMVNGNGSNAGNDAAFDDIQVLDVTPRVEKSFSPAVAKSDGTSTLNFTVTNTSDLRAKKGWSFKDSLPAGLTVADPAATGTTCANGSVDAASGGNSVALKGDLTEGQSSCTLSVDVTAAKGEYKNCPDNVGELSGMKPPTECATVRFADPGYKITKTSTPESGSEAKPGDKVAYKVTVENTGPVSTKTPVTDDLTDVLDDATYNDDAEGSAGTPDYTSPELSWSPTLDAGEKATLTYSVTLKDPATGDGTAKNVVTGSSDSNCVTGAEDGCTTKVTVDKPPRGGYCSDTGYLVQWDGSAYVLSRFDPATGDKTRIGSLGDDRSRNVSIGYSQLDGYLYGYRATSGQLLRIDPDTGTYTSTKIDGIDSDVAAMAATSSDGTKLYVFDHKSYDLYVIDTDPYSDTYSTVLSKKNIGAAHGSGDFDFHPGDGMLYTAAGDGTLWRLDPDAGTWTDLGTQLPSDEQGTAAGTYQTFSDEHGGYYFYGNRKGGLYSLDLSASTPGNPITADRIGEATRIGSTTTTSNADAAGCLRAYDFGDAPDSYGTAKGSDGPVAGADDRLLLGDEVSSERDARAPSMGEPYDATGDTVDDGVTDWPQLSTDMTSYRLPVTLANTTGAPATLAGWIDLDGDGTFGKGELAKAAVPAGATSATLDWSGLTGAEEGGTYARLWLQEGTVDAPVPNTSGGASGDGKRAGSDGSRAGSDRAPVGEIEDYPVTVDPYAPLEIAKSADKADAKPGEKVTYTVSVTNPGKVAHKDVALDDDLSGVVDDATYNKDAEATAGEVSYDAPKLSWKGDVGAGRTVTLTYSVTVGAPPGGDKKLTNAVVSDAPGSNCQEGSDDPDCTTDVGVPTLKFKKTATPDVPREGDTVSYKVTVTNTGEADYRDATFTDDLTRVLDDATYNEDAAASSGDVTYAEPELTWTGDLAKGESATVTYTFTVTDEGDGKFVNGVVGPPGSNCPEDGTDPDCTTVLPAPDYDFGDAPDSYKTRRASGGAFHEVVRGLHMGRSVEPERDGVPHARAGDDGDDDGFKTVTLQQHQGSYTAKVPVTNTTGRGAVLAGWIDSDGDGTFDDAEMATADVPDGATEATLKWDGLQRMKPGETFVRLRLFGDESTAAANRAAAKRSAGRAAARADTHAVTATGYGGPGEVEDHTVRVEPAHLVLTKSASTSEAKPGDTVTYTVTVASSGDARYMGAEFTDDLGQVLDDATYNDDAEASAGDVSYDEPKLSWSGNVPAGEKVTVTYSVTVDDPVTGDRTLANAVTGPPDATCANACTTTVTVPPPPKTPKTPKPPTPSTPTTPDNPDTPPATPPAKPGNPSGHLSDTGADDDTVVLATAAALVLGLGALLLLAVRRSRRRDL